MNAIEKTLFKMLMAGDPEVVDLFESYVQNMGHSKSQAKVIVESILSEDKKLLNEGLSDLARFKK